MSMDELYSFVAGCEHLEPEMAAAMCPETAFFWLAANNVKWPLTREDFLERYFLGKCLYLAENTPDWMVGTNLAQAIWEDVGVCPAAVITWALFRKPGVKLTDAGIGGFTLNGVTFNEAILWAERVEDWRAVLAVYGRLSGDYLTCALFRFGERDKLSDPRHREECRFKLIRANLKGD